MPVYETNLMSIRATVYFLLLLLGNLPVSRAQQPYLRFEHNWGPLPKAAVYTPMLQDRKGLLWFGSYKYDGNRLTHYQFDPLDSTSIAASHVWALWEDPTGLMWMGTNEETCRFDPRTEKFTRLERGPANPYAILHINATNQDWEGNIWVAGNGELRRVDPKSGRYSATNYAPMLGLDSSRNIKQDVGVMYRDKGGTLWLGSKFTGLYRLILTPQGKDKPLKVSFARYGHDETNASSLSDNEVTSIYEDHNGVLWVGCGPADDSSPVSKGGLNAFDPKTGRFTHFVHDPQHHSSLSNNAVTSITEDPQGRLWVGTRSGLNQLNPQRTVFTHYLNDPLNSTSLQHNQIIHLLMEPSGVLWVSTRTGIDKLDLHQKPFALYRHHPTDPHSLSHDAVSALLEDEKGTLWIGTLGGGLNAWDRKTNRFTHYGHEALNPHSLVNNRVSALVQDGQHKLWVANGEVLSRLDKQTGQFTHFPLKHPFIHGNNAPDQVFTLASGKEGWLWVGTTNGIIQFDPQTGAMRSYTHTPNSTEGMSDYWTLALLEDWSGHLWIGHGAHALDKLDLKTGKITRYQHDSRNRHSLSSNSVKSLHQDATGNLWIGTDNGIIQFNPTTGRFTTFTQKHGLTGNTVYSILADNGGNLWLGTDHGLSRFSLSTHTFTNYDSNDGLQSDLFTTDYVGGARCQGRDGTLYFGGENGFNAFHPDAIRPNRYVPPIVITLFILMGKAQPGIDKILPVKQASALIELDYNQNFFSLEFAALSYSSPHKNQYAYQLEGVDKDWVYSGNRHVSTYTDVAPGEYVFRVKGSNNDGIWNEKGTSVRILIHPPWWRTWWFISLVAALVVGLVYTGFRYRVTQIRKEEVQKAAFSKKLSEMEMQALRAQMNPHFIFNSLNSINTFILKNQPDAASDYLAKFSRLIRLILQNSNSATVTLQNELEALQLYLEMEALRFRNKFTFQIRVGSEVEPEEIDIPPLLIQPYVENAIWHGLLHRESTGHLGIDLQIENERLVCVIEDDGVGRQRAAELKSKSATRSKSLGMQITAHRMELMKELYGKETTVEIVDLVDASGEACGTRVVLTISI